MSVSPKLRRHGLLLVTSLLVLIAAGRILRLNLDHKDLHIDEIWSVWQLLGNHTDYTRDATWPPLYYIALDGWRQLVGIDPFVLRYLSTLMFMIGAACAYRAMRRLYNETAAWLGMLAYSALALGTFLTTQARGYALVYSLIPLVFWLTLRYFEHPKLRRAVLLALGMVAMFYTAYGSVGAFLMLGIYTLLVYRQAIWRWWLPGIVAGVLAFPGVQHVWSLTVSRLAPLALAPTPPIIPALENLYALDTGYNLIAWILLAVVATVMLVIYQRPLRMKSLALLVWGFGAIVLYVLNRYLGLFDRVYGWFLVLGAVFWIAWGLSYLPRIARIGATVLLVIVMFTPIPYATLEAEPPPMGQSFELLAKNIQWGDVIVIDPLWQDRYCKCLNPEEFDYLSKLYFPQGLPVVTSPEGYGRVWYLKWDSLEDKAFQAQVQQGRIAGKFVGPPEALFQLYEAPPDPQGVLFDNGLRFHGIELVDQKPGLFVHRVLDSVRVRLWWSVDKPLSADYSISLQAFYNNQLAIQSDSGPQLIDSTLPKATSQWQPGQIYVEEREFTVPRVFITGQYPLFLTVYQSWDNTRIAAPGENADKLLPIQTLYIKAW